MIFDLWFIVSTRFVLYQLSKNLNRPFFFDFLVHLSQRWEFYRLPNHTKDYYFVNCRYDKEYFDKLELDVDIECGDIDIVFVENLYDVVSDMTKNTWTRRTTQGLLWAKWKRGWNRARPKCLTRSTRRFDRRFTFRLWLGWLFEKL